MIPSVSVATSSAGTSVTLSTEVSAADVDALSDARHTHRTMGPRARNCAVSTVTTVTAAPAPRNANMVRLSSTSSVRPNAAATESAVVSHKVLRERRGIVSELPTSRHGAKSGTMRLTLIAMTVPAATMVIGSISASHDSAPQLTPKATSESNTTVDTAAGTEKAVPAMAAASSPCDMAWRPARSERSMASSTAWWIATAQCA
mmetsp:Transcript_738/g.2564  ORF Transcript_738/g.2564 Transcript_738/m.2564 type:complete len:203 (-) Transcript_738:912-1520(-)